MSAEIVTLYESNLLDPAATMRKIASQIESGRYGEVTCVALVLLGDTVEVFSAGTDSRGAATASLL